jgi:hypothetical protein
MSNQIVQLAISIKRYTRDPKVIDLCNAVINAGGIRTDTVESKPPFDKTAYQREFMRRKRERLKAEKLK